VTGGENARKAWVKRALWCRWFHVLRLRESARNEMAPGGGWMLSKTMTGLASRRYCWACRGRWYATRAARRGLGIGVTW